MSQKYLKYYISNSRDKKCHLGIPRSLMKIFCLKSRKIPCRIWKVVVDHLLQIWIWSRKCGQLWIWGLHFARFVNYKNPSKCYFSSKILKKTFCAGFWPSYRQFHHLIYYQSQHKTVFDSLRGIGTWYSLDSQFWTLQDFSSKLHAIKLILTTTGSTK